VYRRWRNAKLDLDRVGQKISARKAAMNGRQSELNAMKEGAGERPQPRRPL
jgi:hypothetical protein